MSFNALQAALDFPIAQDGTTVDDLAVQNVKHFAEAHLDDPDSRQLN